MEVKKQVKEEALRLAAETENSKTDTRIIAESTMQVKSFKRKMNIPPRPFLYRKWYISGYLTGTAATGGTGKTTITDIEAVSMALGIDLFRSKESLKYGQMKVLILSLEDDEEEYQRRLEAIIRHYNLTNKEVNTLEHNIVRLFDSSGSVQITMNDGGAIVRNEMMITALKRTIKEHDIKVMIIDPLISIHNASENANEQMQVVVSALRSIARDTNTAVHYLHHNRKGGGASADDMRGGVALKDGSRALRMLFKPDSDLLKPLNIPAEIKSYLIAEISGKTNFSANHIGSYIFYHTIGVNLENATNQFSADFIGVAALYIPPDLMDGISLNKCQEIWNAMKKLGPELRRSSAQADEWIGIWMMEWLDLNPDKEEDVGRTKEILKVWVKSGVLKKETIDIKYAKSIKQVPIYTITENKKEEGQEDK